MTLTGLLLGFGALTLCVVVGLTLFLRRRFAAGRGAAPPPKEEK